jgi:alpha-glucosidase (family GH31 glycosyl hydrolase)
MEYIPSTTSSFDLVVPGAVSLSIMGMPMVGTQICGSDGWIKGEYVVCTKWAKLASLLPLAVDKLEDAPISG